MNKGIIILTIIVLGGIGFTLFNNNKGVQNDTHGNKDAMMEKIDIDSGVYNVNSEDSTLSYSAKRIASAPHTGTVAISAGGLTFNDRVIESGEFTIDMTKITEDKDNERFLGHIASADFFEVEKFPTATLSITGTNESNGNVVGDLSIKGITNPIEFPVVLSMKDDKVMATADIVINRTKWDIIYDSGSFIKDLGDKAIEDEIYFEVVLFLDKQ